MCGSRPSHDSGITTQVPLTEGAVDRPDDSDRRHRRSLRLKGYDYAQAGAYSVTVVVQSRLLVFGDVVDGKMRLNQAGEMVKRVWDEWPDRFPNIEMDAFVVMPNHIHGIIVVVGAPLVGAPSLAAAQDPNARTTVGAPLVGALYPNARTTVGASLVDALNPDTRATVGASLVGAQDARTTTRVAPTRCCRKLAAGLPREEPHGH